MYGRFSKIKKSRKDYLTYTRVVSYLYVLHGTFLAIIVHLKKITVFFTKSRLFVDCKKGSHFAVKRDGTGDAVMKNK